ncbi:MAG: glutamine--fructose-6-phosphate transaminase (isomerizing) [Candidatus Omnitrophica bacterium]|nr:glutamine--fructose-6-phosphate transaminase (isomerizing) [Candidatus Omnitrophota bacterium]
MCGIIGYIGNKKAPPILIESLKKLEYRGYDSSGIGVISSRDNRLVFRKTKGKISDLCELMKSQPLPEATCGISHTRWATHGEPNRINSHPHLDGSGKFLVVHNGIIENYETLKESLIKKGHKFLSQTDTEVIPHLIQEYYRGDFIDAVKKAIARLKGAFALGIISSNHPDILIAARIGSPLIIGLGKGENFIASDVPAILEHTRKVIYLKDEQLAVLRREKVEVYGFNGKIIKPEINKVSFKVDSVEKQGFPHFMLKEIHEQPAVIQRMLNAHLRKESISFPDIGLSDDELKRVKNIIIVACGTAYHAGMVGKYLIELFSKVPVTVDLSSEFRYRSPIIPAGTVILPISQSGETADTLAAVREAKVRGAKIISICNVVGSSLARESQGVLYTHAGPEIGVASTKAYTAQLCMLYLLALKLASLHKALPAREIKNIAKNLKGIPAVLSRILKDKHLISRVAKRNSHYGCFLFLGRNLNYPSALEGALKLKEISYIPAEGYAAGEMKHGPIALIDEYRAVVCLVNKSDIYEKMISNIQEIRSRKGRVIAIATNSDLNIKKHAADVIYVPETGQLLSPLTVALPLQLIAYYIAVKRGCDVDQPRNLAKSVTVE